MQKKTSNMKNLALNFKWFLWLNYLNIKIIRHNLWHILLKQLGNFSYFCKISFNLEWFYKCFANRTVRYHHIAKSKKIKSRLGKCLSYFYLQNNLKYNTRDTSNYQCSIVLLFTIIRHSSNFSIHFKKLV